jgi:hypothetical protein
MSPTTTADVNGAKLPEACGFNRHLCASIIALRPDWKQLLDSIPAGLSRRNVAVVVWQIREALGKDFDYAKVITQGEA